jgi:hypothetical protein
MSFESPFTRIDGPSLIHPHFAVTAFVEQLTKGVPPTKRWPQGERRQEIRFPIASIIEVQPLDAGFRTHGTAYQVVTRDLSFSGIGFLDARLIPTTHLAVQLTNPFGEQLQVLLQVLRCSPRGEVYDIGGKFVLKADA